jgi:hypothetical protein
MHVQDYLQLISVSEGQMAEAFTKVANHHIEEPDIHFTCLMLASWSERHVDEIEPLRKKYSKHAGKTREPERLNQTLFKEPRKGALALLRDLHDLWLLTKEIEICWKVLLQAARALRVGAHAPEGGLREGQLPGVAQDDVQAQAGDREDHRQVD